MAAKRRGARPVDLRVVRNERLEAARKARREYFEAAVEEAKADEAMTDWVLLRWDASGSVTVQWHVGKAIPPTLLSAAASDAIARELASLDTDRKLGIPEPPDDE